MNKEITCCGSTMVLGKWLPCEHIGVRHTWCRSTMVLDKWFPYEHIGVRHDVVGKKNWWSNSTLLLGWKGIPGLKRGGLRGEPWKSYDINIKT